MTRKTPSDDALDELVGALREAGDMLRKQHGTTARLSYDEAADAIWCLRRDLRLLASTVVVRVEELEPGDRVVLTPSVRMHVHSVRVVDDVVEVAWDAVNAPKRAPVGRECRRELR